jgi:alpha-L-rhamnosidase
MGTGRRTILLKNWTAKMISPDEDFWGAPLLRKEFRLDVGHGDVVEAMLHSTAWGVFTARVNGAHVADDVFTPGWTLDAAGFLRDWLADLAAEQRAAAGRVPFVVPDIFKHGEPWPEFPTLESTAIWGDAAVWVPWALWQAYGKVDVLAESFGSMTAHVTRVESLVSESGPWDSGFQFGDWLDPTAPPDQPFLAKADKGVVATACLYRSARMVAGAATILDQPEDTEHFLALADRTRAAFNEHYLSSDGRVHSDCPTVYALAICFGLLDPVGA